MPISEIRKQRTTWDVFEEIGGTHRCLSMQLGAILSVGCSDNFSRLPVVDLSIQSWLLWSLRAWTARLKAPIHSALVTSEIIDKSQGPNHQAHWCQTLPWARKSPEEASAFPWWGGSGEQELAQGLAFEVSNSASSMFSRNNGDFLLKQDDLKFCSWLQLISPLVLLSLNSLNRGRMPSKSRSKCFYCCKQTHSWPPTSLTVCHVWASRMEAL